ncbi:hypothetical protein D3C71_1163070 [compost metagenome]
MRLVRHLAGVAFQHGVQRWRRVVLLPHQILGHRAKLEVADTRGLKRLRQRLAGLGRIEVQIDEANQIPGAGLHAIGFGGQRAGIHPHRCIGLVVALGVAVHGRLGNLDIGIAQPQRRKQHLFHGCVERHVPGLGRRHAQQAYAGIGIAASRARRIGGFPGAQIGRQLRGSVYAIGYLQGKAARGMRGEAQQIHLGNPAALQLRQELGRAVGQ